MAPLASKLELVSLGKHIALAGGKEALKYFRQDVKFFNK